MKSDLSINHWVDLLISPNNEQREMAERYLVSLGNSALPALTHAVTGKEGPLRWQAAAVSARVGVKYNLTIVKELLLSSDLIVAEIAGDALGKLGSPEAVSILIEALPKVSMILQLEITITLKKIGDRRAVAPLMKLLQTSQPPSLQYAIIEALGALGDRQAIELIREHLNDEDDHTRSRARKALSKLGVEI